jgi:hypothetical protein
MTWRGTHCLELQPTLGIIVADVVAIAAEVDALRAGACCCCCCLFRADCCLRCGLEDKLLVHTLLVSSTCLLPYCHTEKIVEGMSALHGKLRPEPLVDNDSHGEVDVVHVRHAVAADRRIQHLDAVGNFYRRHPYYRVSSL